MSYQFGNISSKERMRGSPLKSYLKISSQCQISANQEMKLEGSAMGGSSLCSAKKVDVKVRENLKSDEVNNIKRKYSDLLKIVEDLRKELKSNKDTIMRKNNEIKNLKHQLQELNDRDKLYSSCAEDLSKSKLKISHLEIKLKEKDCLVSDMKEQLSTNIAQNEKTLLTIKNNHEEVLSVMNSQHKREKEKLTNDLKGQYNKENELLKDDLRKTTAVVEELKKKTARDIHKNSAERQEQINELLKELKRVSEEAEVVKCALKKLKTNQKCGRCEFFESKCKEMTKELLQKETICKDLITVCSKMEKQLIQHDEFSSLLKKLDLTG